MAASRSRDATKSCGFLDAIERARDGQGSIVEIGGGPGTGKTRLLEEVIARSSDFRVITARCQEFEASTPYFPFRALLRDVIDADATADGDQVAERLRSAVEQLDTTLVAWVPLLGILIGVDLPDTPETAVLDERFLRDRLSDVAMRFIDGSLEGTPTMIVVEDGQYLDEASRTCSCACRWLLRNAAGATSPVKQRWQPAGDDAVHQLDRTGAAATRS